MVLILGAFFGFLSGAYLSDAIGRKATFMVSAIGSVVLMAVYLFAPLSNDLILPVGFLLGYINLMMFSPMGPFMTELFPTAVAASDRGFCYNAGRGIGRPWVFSAPIGFLPCAIGFGGGDRDFYLRALGVDDRGLANAAGNQRTVPCGPGTARRRIGLVGYHFSAGQHKRWRRLPAKGHSG